MTSSRIVLACIVAALLYVFPALGQDVCHQWIGAGSLQAATNQYQCVQVGPGTHVVQDQVTIPPGHELRGAGRGITWIVADQAVFPIDGRSVLTAGWSKRDIPRLIVDLSVHGSSVAMNGICCFDFILANVEVTGALCAGVTIAGPGVAIVDSLFHTNSWGAFAGTRGWMDCTKNPQGGNVWGGGIYVAPVAGFAAPVIVRTTMTNNYGPGLDCWGAKNGYVADSDVNGNRGWAGVHLYGGCTGWTITASRISHQAADFFPHQDCYPQSPGPSGAAVRICEKSTSTKITMSVLTGTYAVLAGSKSCMTALAGNTNNGLVAVTNSCR